MTDYLQLARERAPQTPINEENPYLPMAQEQQKLQQSQVRTVLELAYKDNPDVAAERQRLSQTSGVPLRVVERNLEELRVKEQARAVDLLSMAQDSPVLYRQLMDPTFTTTSVDDLDTLKNLEKTVKGLPRDLAGAATSLGLGATVGVGKMLFDVAGVVNDLIGWESGAKSARQSAKRAQESMDYFGMDAESSTAKAVKSGLQSAGQNLAMLPIGLERSLFQTANSAASAVAGLMSAGVGADAFNQAREQGKGILQAGVYAIPEAAFEFVFEQIPASKLFGDIAANTGLVKTIGKQMFSEGWTEQVTTVAQDFNEWMNLHPEKTLGDFIAERPDAAYQTFIATLVGVGVQTTTIKGIDKIIEKASNQKLTFEQDQFQEQMALAAQSLLRSRSPEQFRAHIQQVLDNNDGAKQEIFVDGQVLAQLPQDVLAQLPASVQEQIAEAAASSSPVAIPMADVLTIAPGTPLEQVLNDNARMTPESLSRVEVQQAGEKAQEFIKNEAERVLAEAQDQQAWATSSENVKNTIWTQLNDAGRFSSDVNEAYATLQMHFFSTMAARLGLTPEELYQRYSLKAGAQAGQGAVLNAGEKVGEVSVEGYHFSPVDRSVLTTEAFGTGLKGSARDEILNHPDKRLRQRLSFYFDKGTGIRPESGVGGRAHRVQLTGVYDSDADPLKLRSGDARAFESKLLDLGYNGYLTRMDGTQPGQVIMLGKQNFKPELLGAQSRIENGQRVAPLATVEPQWETQASGEPAMLQMKLERMQSMPAWADYDMRIEGRELQVRKKGGTYAQSLSSRLPSAVKATEDPLASVLNITFDTVLSDTKTLEKNVAALQGLPNVRKLKGKGAKDPVKNVEAFIDHVTKNLLWLHDHMPKEMRERAHLWYDGGRKTVEAWADRYGISEMQGAAAIAVLSPQNGWFANVSQAERIADMVFGLRDFAWDDAMTAEARRISSEDGLDPRMEAAVGKTLGELLATPDIAARWARVYDQTYNNRAYRVLTPEGGAADYVKTGKGADATMMWKSYSTIAKAISVLMDGRAENVHYQIGKEHKVRNFYNNLFAPNSELGYATIDTHAVAAALLRPLASADIEVAQAFGGGGSSSSAVTGLNGTYPIYLEAYRRAAEARGILPREMQSITWEAVRGLFEAAKKSGLKKPANAIWERYKAGEIDQEQAQKEILALAGDITPPSWTDVPFNDTPSRTYEGPAQKAIDERGNVGAAETPTAKVMFEVAPDPNDAALTAEWNALSSEERLRISQEVAAKVVPKVLKELGTDGDFVMQLGGYMGATNPSMTLRLARPELSLTAAKLLGHALAQDSMMVVTEDQVVGSEEVGAVTIQLPEGYGEAQVAALYDRLWELKSGGQELVGGHTTADGQMVILNYSNLTTEELSKTIFDHLGGEFDVASDTIYSAFPSKEDYGYGQTDTQPEGNTASRQSPAQRRPDNLRAEATQLLREALDARRAGPAGAYAQEGVSQTPEFQAWFGDSKVVDENGQPLVVYHGTNQAIDSFDPAKIGSRDAGFFGSGFYFTPNEDEALDYADSAVEDSGTGEAQAIPLVVSLQNPFVWDMSDESSAATRQALAAMGIQRDSVRGNSASLGNAKERETFNRAVRAAGHDGVIVRDEDGILEVVAFEPEQIKSVSNQAPTNDPSIYKQGPRGTFNPQTLLVTLGENADLSTFLHESGHFFLEVMADLASQPGAPQQIVDDMAATMKWFGVPDLATWNSYTLDQKRPYHEKWAESFEQYLLEGKAPNAELQGLFRRFRSWMVNVYKSLTHFMRGRNLQVSDEIRKVFDRMVATDEQIAQAEETAGLLPDFDATNEAIEKLQARSLRDLKWAVNARNKAIKALQKQAAELRKGIEEEVTIEVNQMPEVRAKAALDALQVTPDHQVLLNEHKEARKAALDTTTEEITQQLVAEEVATNGELKGLKKGQFLAKQKRTIKNLVEARMIEWDKANPKPQRPVNATDQDMATVADSFGYATVEEMLAAIDAFGSKADMIEGMTDQRMLERHGDLIDQRAIEDAANEAVHNEARAKSLATELKSQAEMLNPRQDTGQVNAKGSKITVNAITEAAKQFAQNLVARRRVKDLRNAAHQHRAAEARAGKRWQEATAAGNTKDAVAAKRDQVLNNYTVKALQEAQLEAKKILEFFRRVTKDSNEKTVTKGRDPDVVNAMRAILASYDVAPRLEKSATEYLDVVEKNDPAMHGVLKASVDAALANAKPIAEMTMEELRGLFEEMQAMWHLAKRSRQMEIDGNLMDMQDAEDELQARMQAIGVPSEMPGESGALTKREELARKLQFAGSILRRVEQWAQGMGNEFTRLVFQPVKDAANAYRADRVKYRKKYQALIDNVAPSLTKGLIEAPELGYTFGKGHNGIGHAELLHAILHTGNESNKRKLLLGRRWATENADGTLDTTKWDAFLKRMHDTGVLNKAHYDFAQGVWDLLEETKPLAQKTHRDVFGRYFAEVTADSFDTPFGSYRGGYVPAQADPRIVQDADLRKLAEAENENMAFSFPGTNKGFTKGRVDYNRPLMLDLRTIGQHIDKVLLFSHMEPAVRDVQKLLSRKGVSYSLGRIDPTLYAGMLTPWLNRSARQIVETPIVGDGGVSRVLSAARNRAGMALMFANVSNTIQQLTGFSLAAVKVKPSSMMKATAEFIASPKKMAKAVSDASEFMANRMENEISAINDAMDEILLDPNLYEKAQAWSQKHAYFLQTAMANTMEPIIWTAAYNDAIAQGQGDKDAVRHADSVVRTTQGSTLPEDVSRIETGPAYARMFTQFVGYFNMMANTNATELKKISQEMGLKKGAGKALGVVALGMLVPLWIAEAIAQAMRGGPDDEDKDGYLDDWLAAVFGMGTIKGSLAMVPFIGQLANAGINRFNGNPADDKMSLSPAVSLLESAVGVPVDIYKAITGDVNKRNMVRDVASAVSIATGLPAVAVARPLGYLAGVADDKIDPTGPVDLARGVVTGTASPASK
jgi:hypothetical protein